MKKSFYFIVSLIMVSIMSLSSCRKVDSFNNPGELRTITFNATTEDGSKTYLDGRKVRWESGDKILVNGSTFDLQSGAGETSATFHGTASGSSFLAGYKATSGNASSLTFNIPANQSGNTANLSGILPMAAYAATGNDNLAFKNLVNIIKFELKSTTNASISQIELTSTSEKLSGNFTVNSSLVPSAANGTNKITVSKNMNLNNSTQYVYVIIPKFANQGTIKIKFIGTNGVMQAPITISGNTYNKIFTVQANVKLEKEAYFTVNSSGKKVIFSKGNLYYNGSTYQFENSMYDYQTSWNSNHVDHFYWSSDASIARSLYYSGSASGVLFTNATADTPNPSFTVAGQTGVWRTLTNEEWMYLQDRAVAGINRTVAPYETPDSRKGVVVVPDNYIELGGIYNTYLPNTYISGGYHDAATWNTMVNAGVIFIPNANKRNDATFNEEYKDGSIVGSCLGSIYTNNGGNRCCMYHWYGGSWWATTTNANDGRLIRLVQDY